MISGIPADEIKRQDKANVLCPLGTGEYTWRFWGKKCNHSLNYDLGYKQFALRFEMGEGEAKQIVERFHRVYPGIRHYHAWVRAALSANATLTNCYGRTRVFLERWGDELF
jgi:DNA polymerase I-like protein with 3'-5' exonuclease and polymerase domains